MFGCIAAKVTVYKEQNGIRKFVLQRTENDTVICEGVSINQVEAHLAAQGYKLDMGTTCHDQFGYEYQTCAITRIDGKYGTGTDIMELTTTATYTASAATIAKRHAEFMGKMRLENGTRFAQLYPDQADERTLAHLAIQDRAYRAMLDDLDKGLDAPHADPPIYYSPRTRAYFTLGKLHIAGADMYGDD